MALRIQVKGRVQGVGYRAFVCQEARALGLVGEVWNRLDGAVELLADGDEPDLIEFVERLKQGVGRVDTIVTEPIPNLKSNVFTVGSTRP